MTATADTRLRVLERDVRTNPAELPRYVLELARAGQLPSVGNAPIVCVEVLQTQGLKTLRSHPWGIEKLFPPRQRRHQRSVWRPGTWWAPAEEDGEILLAPFCVPLRPDGRPFVTRARSRRTDPALSFKTPDELASWLATMTVRLRFLDEPCNTEVRGAFPMQRSSCVLPWWHNSEHVG